MSDSPFPVAPVLVHEDQCRPVAMLPPSALKPISEGSRPVQSLTVSTGSEADAVGVLRRTGARRAERVTV